MKMTKISLIMIAVVAVGLFALPSTLSIGSGQHKFKQAGSANTTVGEFCGQCHGVAGDQVKTELEQSDVKAKNLGYGVGIRIHSTFGTAGDGCANCHAITEDYGTQQVTSEHAAKLPSCLKCHGPDPAYNVGNDVTGTNVNTSSYGKELAGSQEAHKAIFQSTQGTDDDIMCIGCHTYVNKTGTITYGFSNAVTVQGLVIGD